ncbi:helix-hairpin-helix domain-containing protein [Desulfolithobacter dissulfuricans]|nr:helix-hairpin-helix domain-containing protein [Desulfolithobacter dissulfuricans]
MRIRDESHRFGITFHRRLRNAHTLHSVLDEIPGIGPARKKLLLETFGSYRRLCQATPDELAALPGIGPVLAAILHSRLQDNRNTE